MTVAFGWFDSEKHDQYGGLHAEISQFQYWSNRKDANSGKSCTTFPTSDLTHAPQARINKGSCRFTIFASVEDGFEATRRPLAAYPVSSKSTAPPEETTIGTPASYG
jgi:hypothetical protein